MDPQECSRAGRSRTKAVSEVGRTRRAEILRVLRERTTATAAELADAVGVHPNTIRFHLRILERSGDVVREQVPSRTPGRPELRFRLSPSHGSTELRADLLARILLNRIAASADSEREAESAGHQWGSGAAATAGASAADAIEGLVDTLEATGFAPTRSEADMIELHNCPLREFLATHGRLVCSIHRGLMSGYLDAAESSSAVESLEPFATAASCRARLRRRAPAAGN